MKKHFMIILAVLTLFVYDKTQAQNAYNFTEAKDSVAKIIWDKLKTEDECISSVINQLKKIDSKQLAKAEHYKSKTAMDFDFQTIDEYFVEEVRCNTF